MVRTFLSTLCTLLLCISSLVPSFANEASANRSISWTDGSESQLSSGALYKTTRLEDLLGSRTVNSPCFGLFSNLDCDNINEGEYQYATTLVLCEEEPRSACISSIELETAAGTVLTGINVGEWVKQVDEKEWPAKILDALPPRRTSNVFLFRASQTESYTIDVSPRMRYQIKDGNLSERYLELRAMPLRPSPETAKQLDNDSAYPCVMPWATATCFVSYDLPPDFRLRISMLTKSFPQGWVNGRALRPEINYRDADELVEISFTGGFLPTPEVFKRYWYSSLTDREVWNKLTTHVGAPWNFNCGGPSPCGSAGPGLVATDIDDYSTAVEIDPDLDKAHLVRQKLVAAFTWAPPSQSGWLSLCGSEGFIGFVGSNALTFEGTAPKFDSRSQELTYRVSSPHFMPDGQTFDGVYELIVSRKVADCLWGSGSIKARAVVQVVSENNQQKVHSSVTRQAPDFVALTVTGFTYSESKVKIKMEKETPAVTLIPKKKTIVCVTTKKPAKLKKVTALTPKCPKGYKPR